MSKLSKTIELSEEDAERLYDRFKRELTASHERGVTVGELADLAWDLVCEVRTFLSKMEIEV